ncbi:TIGR03086 family metal-binding protein [Mycolicibacter icosiumassiliensis]|uniref:TIGR03086 family metal-binding protein n=1 Tax=Mycolicibacter icosiumassiliensis TaxID=1792835 RepID=UPI0008339C36|nr:TIGR03086 family metal-binding protein [Mycolicibacter icosiumassiliensis]
MEDATHQIGLLATAALDLLIDAVDHIPASHWDQPSNLEDWSLRDLVGHATGSTAKIVALIENRDAGGVPSRPADWVCVNPGERLRSLAVQLHDVLPDLDPDAMRTSPMGEVPLQQALAFPVADLALHSWDVHRSLGQQVELPKPLLAFCRELVEPLPEDMLRRPGAFGPAQHAPEGSSPTTVLMAYLGRSVDGSS